MEDRAVESRLVGADGGKCGRARRQEGVVPGALDAVEFRLARQGVPHGVLVERGRLMAVVRAAPELHRDLHLLQAGPVEGETEGRRCRHDRLDAAIHRPHACRRLCDRRRIDAGLLQGAAEVVRRMRSTVGRDGRKTGHAAGGDQHGESSVREAERADARRIDALVAEPFAQHVVDQSVQLMRATPQLQHPALVPGGIPGMVDRSHDEARLREGSRNVLVPVERAPAAMRHDDQRPS